MKLQEKAMLVRLSRSMWSPYKYDKTATKAAEEAANVHGVGRYNKRLLAGSLTLKRVQSAFTDVYTYVIRNTLPWLDQGVRLLPAHTYLEFSSHMRDKIVLAMAEVENLQMTWDADVEQDRLRLGALFNPLDYPSHAEIAGLWRIDIRYMPVPSEGDFRVQISQEDRESVARELAEAERQAKAHVVQIIMEPLAHAVERLAEYKGEDKQKLHTSTLGNILEATELAARLDLSGDPALRQRIDAVRRMAQAALARIDSLRESQPERDETRGRLDDALSELAAFA